MSTVESNGYWLGRMLDCQLSASEANETDSMGDDGVTILEVLSLARSGPIESCHLGKAQKPEILDQAKGSGIRWP